MKFLRTYRLSIETPENELITVEPPYSIHFNVERNVMSQMNKADITLYELPGDIRSKLWKDKYTFHKYWKIVLQAGYKNDSMSTIFFGNATQIYSSKEMGSWKTEISAHDGAFALQGGYLSKTFTAGTQVSGAVKDLLTGPNVTAGVFGTVGERVMNRDESYSGSTKEVLDKITQGFYYIDNQELNVLKPDEFPGYAKGVKAIITPDDWLGSPKRIGIVSEGYVIFEPKIIPNYLLEVQSYVKELEGEHRVLGFEHDVTISESECGEARTKITFEVGVQSLTLRKNYQRM